MTQNETRSYRVEDERILPRRNGNQHWPIAEPPDAQKDGRRIDFKWVQEVDHQERIDIVAPRNDSVYGFASGRGAKKAHVGHKIVPPPASVRDNAPRQQSETFDHVDPRYKMGYQPDHQGSRPNVGHAKGKDQFVSRLERGRLLQLAFNRVALLSHNALEFLRVMPRSRSCVLCQGSKGVLPIRAYQLGNA